MRKVKIKPGEPLARPRLSDSGNEDDMEGAIVLWYVSVESKHEMRNENLGITGLFLYNCLLIF